MVRIGIIAAALAFVGCGSSGPATHFRANMSAANEPGTVTSSGTGTADYTVDGGMVNYTVTFSGLTANANAGHMHVGPAGVNGGVTVPFTVPANTGATFSGSFTGANVRAATALDGGISVLDGGYDELLTLMRAGNTYTNIHTSTYPGGEIRGQNQPQ